MQGSDRTIRQPASTAVTALGITALGQFRAQLGPPRGKQASPGPGKPSCLAVDDQRSLGKAMFASAGTVRMMTLACHSLPSLRGLPS